MSEQPTMEELRAKYGPQVGITIHKPRYAGEAGKGPAGETCGSCGHQRRSGNTKTYPKCGLVAWTSGDATTILTRTKACEHWTKPYEITAANHRNPPR
jgi:hypothetical protein